MNFIKNKSVLILGLGESGLACIQFCQRFNACITVADSRSMPPNLSFVQSLAHVKLRLGSFSVNLLNGIDVLVISPGIAPYSIQDLLDSAKEKHIPVLSELDWFNNALLELNQHYNYYPTVLGITGTNGKTTVTELTAHICNQAGLKAVACGNISPAALTALLQALDQYTHQHIPLPDVWVLELSSFQLHYTQQLQLNAAALLNISQDHLDWHKDIQAYILDKAKIFKHCSLKIINRDDPLCMGLIHSNWINSIDKPNCSIPHNIKTFGLNSPSSASDMGCNTMNGIVWLTQAQLDTSIPIQQQHDTNESAYCITKNPLIITKALIPAHDILLQGTHNHANALAAILLTQAVGISFDHCIQGLRTYHSAPSRCELIRIVNGVSYINDSKGTNVGATVAALTGLSQDYRHLILIAGGEGKAQDFSNLAHAILASCKAVILIGKSAHDIEQSILSTQLHIDYLPIKHANSLEEAVICAYALANYKDTVLLSPACASFDMFKNYQHRASVFIDAVNQL